MEKMKTAWVSPVLSANPAQAGRVVGKPAKEQPKQNKRHFREFLHPSGGEKPEDEREERLDTFA
ncbi:hypothetical protein C8D99_102136 [Aminivibrio pyruvatiphilus]|jgi:hypothetical protein|uniref:Uncharacterized protein n=1 Tax=Aminivibrio pyruvatiphilus TaxID=1005740 RepID=A0A4R8MGV0_9BACT|nr:hypothetical protein [Aminivibrio pyruvatiphilus]TDY63155.1 hypothetical protein C8D99_102136 [Aminivibrio pyruvatiphilus]